MAIKQKITSTSIKNLTIEQQRMNDTEISGFHARISPKGTIKYYLYYRLHGKQRNYLIGSASALTPTQARDMAKEKAGLIAGGEDIQLTRHETKKQEMRKSLTLRRFLDEHYKPYLYAMNPKQAHKSFVCISNTFKHLENKSMDSITAWDIQQWISQKSKQGRAPATMTYAFNRLKAAFNRAKEWDFIDAHNLDSVRLPKVDNTVVRYLKADEEQALLAQLKARDQELRENKVHDRTIRQGRFIDYFEPLVLIAMNTGMRRGEMFTLKWENISFENRYLTITAENAKSKKTRTIPLNDTAYHVLLDWRQQTPDSDYVFTQRGHPIRYIQTPWEKVLTGAGITNFRFHDLRHHFASKLVMAGADLNIVRELLGHSDMKMTLRYAHLAPEHKAAAVNLIG